MSDNNEAKKYGFKVGEVLPFKELIKRLKETGKCETESEFFNCQQEQKSI